MNAYTHGRLVARLKRLIARMEARPSDLDRRLILLTVRDLIIEERRLADPLAKAETPTPDEVQARLKLMTPGGGIEVAR